MRCGALIYNNLISGNNADGWQVDITLDSGELLSVDGGQVDSPPVTGYSTTDENGSVVFCITRDSVGSVNTTCELHCSSQATVGIPFYDVFPDSDIVFVIDCSGSMWGHEASNSANASVQTFVREIASALPNCRFGAVMFNTSYIQRSIIDYEGQNRVEEFCAWVQNNGGAGGGTTAQMDALNAAVGDLETYSSSNNRRFVVFVTDAKMDNSSQEDHLELVQDLDALTQDNGGGVFISVWEDPGGLRELYNHYNVGFTKFGVSVACCEWSI